MRCLIHFAKVWVIAWVGIMLLYLATIYFSGSFGISWQGNWRPSPRMAEIILLAWPIPVAFVAAIFWEMTAAAVRMLRSKSAH